MTMGLRSVRDDIRNKTEGMTRKQKAGYIFTYYWYWMAMAAGAAAIVIYLIVHFTVGVRRPQYSLAMADAVQNESLNEEIANSFAAENGLDQRRVIVDSGYIFSFGNYAFENTDETDYDRFFFQWGNGEFDAILMSEDMYTYCKSIGGEFLSLDGADLCGMDAYRDPDDGQVTGAVLGTDPFMKKAALPSRKIEVYGDSVSAGEVSEAVGFVGRPDPPHQGEYSNSWYSYAWKTARKLHAEIHDIAQGGIALLDGTGWYHEPDSQGMLSVWDKTEYNSRLSDITPWDFSSWIPDAVVLAVGQNDSHPVDYMAKDPVGGQAEIWREGYAEMLRNLRRVYPDTPIVCITTVLQHSAAWDLAIDEAIRAYRRESGDRMVYRFLFRRNGRATPGHPRITEAEEMAVELSSFMRPLLGRAIRNQDNGQRTGESQPCKLILQG